MELTKKQVKEILKKNNLPVATIEQEINKHLEQMSESQKEMILQKCIRVLADFKNNPNVNFDIIRDVICDHHETTFDAINNIDRHKQIVQVRQRIMYFCNYFKIGSLEFIAQKFNGTSRSNGLKNHATVINGIKKIKNSTFRNMIIQHELEEIEDKIINFSLTNTNY